MLGDIRCKKILKEILNNGCKDKNPRPHYEDVYKNASIKNKNGKDYILCEDGKEILVNDNQEIDLRGDDVVLKTPAHTISVNHILESYDLSKGELPIISLRPIAIKSAIGELLWIYQDQSNDLDLLRDKYGVTWWDEWMLPEEVSLKYGWPKRSIGDCYGENVRVNDSMNKLLNGIEKDPDGRRHILNMWQEEDFKRPHGLKPCAFMTQFNVVHKDDGDYLDMVLYQRSSDYGTAGIINQMQYIVFQMLVARHCGYKPGKFSWFVDNIQLYDRHIDNAFKMIERESVECKPYIWLNPDKKNFYDFTIDDIKLMGYPRNEIKEKNPQLKFEIAI